MSFLWDFARDRDDDPSCDLGIPLLFLLLHRVPKRAAVRILRRGVGGQEDLLVEKLLFFGAVVILFVVVLGIDVFLQISA